MNQPKTIDEKIEEVLYKDHLVMLVCKGCGQKQGYAGFPECIKTGKVSHDMQLPLGLLSDIKSLIEAERKAAYDQGYAGLNMGVLRKFI